MKKSAVLYHYPCPDGAFAALAAHLYFSATSSSSSSTCPPTLFFPNTVYTPLRVQDLPLSDIHTAYLLDFVGPPGFVKDLSSKLECVVVLDHHKTALETFKSETSVNVTKVIDMDRSGATIAFDFFKDKLLALGDYGQTIRKFEHVRPLFNYIQDADLWKWNLPNSKAFSSGLKDLNIEFNANLNPSLFHQLLSLDLDSVIKQGLLSLSHKQRLIDEVLNQSYEIALGGGDFGRCLAANADSVTELRSELGHQLANKSCRMNLRAIGAVVYGVPELKNDQMLKISLRSIDHEDTTPISQNFGGGGHRNASSFMLRADSFEQWKICGAIGAVVYGVPELKNDQMLKISLRSIDHEDTTPISQNFGGGGHRNASSFMLRADSFEQWKICG